MNDKITLFVHILLMIEIGFAIGLIYFVSRLLGYQLKLLSKDVSGLEYMFEPSTLHGQYSKGTEMQNLLYYLGPTIFHIVWPFD